VRNIFQAYQAKTEQTVVGMLLILLVGWSEQAGGANVDSGKPQVADSAFASSEIRRESNGFWLYADGKPAPALPGLVYQPVENSKHIDAYRDDYASLYTALDDESLGGRSHGKSLEWLGVRAIRVYELPVENSADAARVKGIFRRLHRTYRIKVLVGDWAGLYSHFDFRNPGDLAKIQTHLRKLILTYGEEPWILGWQLGNENNYHIRMGILGREINLDAAQYYALMDNFAGVVREDIGRRGLRQFIALGQGDLTEEEAGLIARMKNIDAVGINCSREGPARLEQVIAVATNFLRVAIYFAEVGRPAITAAAEERQGEHLRQVCTVAFSHSAGGVKSGCVLGAFIHEATDEGWKRHERGREEDAHFGILGKSTERLLHHILRKQHYFSTEVLPVSDATDHLIEAAWRCIKGPYATNYGPDYGNAMAYAGRAIMLYAGIAQAQQRTLRDAGAPLDAGASTNAWALTTVGTGYFIIGTCRMWQARDLSASQDPPSHLAQFKKLWQPYELGRSSNVLQYVKYARDVFQELDKFYPYAHLMEAEGRYRRFDRAIQNVFPELSPPFIRPTVANAALFTFACLGPPVLLSIISRRQTVASVVRSNPVMNCREKGFFLVGLCLNAVILFYFLTWWVHPVRMNYYTVSPVLYWPLTGIGAADVFFYFYVWHLLWNMRKPVWISPPRGCRVAMVTTRTAGEPVKFIEPTLRKLDAVMPPPNSRFHSYLLDEEDNRDAKWWCDFHGVIHFSRREISEYNRERGPFQQWTKGGNLNAWLDRFGRDYDFVTFLDPDHAPNQDFLQRVLGYFKDPDVAFVQAAQVFRNRDGNLVPRGAAEQSYFFYGPIQMGLYGVGACVVNGSHSTFRIADLLPVEERGYAVHDADDILTSIRLHARGKQSVYVPEVIAEGLAPDSWDEFAKQQRRWAASMLDLLFHYYPRALSGMPFQAKLAYVFLACFYLLGVAFSGLLVIPFLSVFMGNPPANAHLVSFCCWYLPFLLLHYVLLLWLGQHYLVLNGSRKGFWWRAGLLWVGTWWHYLQAFIHAIPPKKVPFRKTARKWEQPGEASWRSVWHNAILACMASGAFVWVLVFQPGRLETVWGMLLFLGLIALSQGFIAVRVLLLRLDDARKPEEREALLEDARVEKQRKSTNL
jgi:cellulose synthase (UDP-forming)